MNIIIHANERLFEEVKAKDMCEALRGLFHDEIEEATREAREKALFEGESRAFIALLREGILSVTDVASRLNVTEVEVQAMLGN